MESISLSNRLSPILDEISTALVHDQWKYAIKRISDTFPPLKHAIIELREKPYSAETDLMICVSKQELATKFFDYNTTFDQVLFKKRYPDLYAFLNIWRNEKIFLNTLLFNIYIVFDIDSRNAKNIKPWIYLAFKRIAFPADLYLTTFLESAKFLPYDFPQESISILESVLQKAKGKYFVFGFGLLHQRGEEKLRIGISDLQKITNLADCLFTNGWTGDTDEVISQMAFMDSFCHDYVLSLKISEQIEDEIGVECNLGKKGNFRRAKELLSYLETHFKYDVRRSESILKWINTNNYDSKNEVRWLNHIKLVYKNGSIVGIKPYLYFDFIDL